MAKAVPDSRIPRRFNEARTMIAVTANHTLWSSTKGIAEPMFDAADDIDTATVST